MGTSECFDSSNQGPRPRRFEQLIGDSPALEAVLDGVKRVAPTSSTVLIQGETGTGKELVARAIHNISSRCGRPFIKLNCAAIPLDLLESELFGHEKGAFTGAIAQRLGRFELADKGTLFLDEVRHQRWNILAALSQRRQLHWKYIEAKIKVTAELAIFHHLRQVAMGCSYEPNIDLVSPAAAQAFEFLLLQYTEKLGL